MAKLEKLFLIIDFEEIESALGPVYARDDILDLAFHTTIRSGQGDVSYTVRMVEKSMDQSEIYLQRALNIISACGDATDG